jgi:hypothetical protein
MQQFVENALFDQLDDLQAYPTLLGTSYLQDMINYLIQKDKLDNMVECTVKAGK